MRRARRHIILPSGHAVRADDHVAADIAAANRDTAVFGPDAGAFNLRRETGSVQPFGIAFGAGPHTCIGLFMAIGKPSIDGAEPTGTMVRLLLELYRAGMRRDPDNPSTPPFRRSQAVRDVPDSAGEAVMSEVALSSPQASAATAARSKKRDSYALLMGITSGWLLLWFVLPIVLMAVRFVGDGEFWSADPVGSLLGPLYLRVFVNTLEVAVVVTLGCLIIGYPVAYYLTTVRQRLFNFLILLVLFPMWVNIVVRTYALLVMLGRNGIVNNAMVEVGPCRTNRCA